MAHRMSEKDGKNEAERSGKANIRLFPGLTHAKQAKPYSGERDRDRQSDRQTVRVRREGTNTHTETHTSEVEGLD